MNNSKLTAMAASMMLLFSNSMYAHRAWILPSATVLSGADKWVTVDAAISNDLFYFEHHPMRLEGLIVYAPDGSTVKPESPNTGKYRSTFDVQLTQQGTYKMAIATQSVFATYELNGDVKRWRGAEANLKTEVPANAQKLQVNRMTQRIESFVTAGKPTRTVLTPSNKGLELWPETHPNDLAAGETAKFALLLDGKPAAGVAVTVVPGGNRYRDNLKEVHVKTDAAGKFSIPFAEPGMYWLNATVASEGSRSSYIATLEVLPQ